LLLNNIQFEFAATLVNYLGNNLMKNSSFLKTGVAVLALLLSQFAFAGQAGTVTFKTGDVTIMRADKTVIKAEKNVALNAGDTIETKNGRLQLSLIDGGKVSLQPNTIYRINKYEFSGKEDGTEYGFTELIKGGLRTVSGLIGHKNRDRYQLKTAVATIGIRGTEFTVNFNNNQLLMTTNHGSVDVCNAGGCLNATTGQSIGVAGPGKKPKPSDVAATASAAAPAGEETKVASNDSKDAKSDSNAKPTSGSNAANASTDSTAADTASTTGSGSAGSNSGGTSGSNSNSGSSNAGSTTSISPSAQVGSSGLPVTISSSMNDGPGTVVSLAVDSCGCTSNGILSGDLKFEKTGSLKEAKNGGDVINPNKNNPISFNTDGIVAWGQFADAKYKAGGVNFNNAMRYDYIAGATPNPGALARLTGTYNVFASTAPFLVSGSTASTVGAANTTTGSLTFNFSTSVFTYGLTVLAANNTFVLGGGGSLVAGSPNFYGNNGQSSIVGAACLVASCSGALNNGTNPVQGSFLGANGERIGLQYGFNVPSLNGAIYGGAVLK
jgi:hypothetical protein